MKSDDMSIKNENSIINKNSSRLKADIDVQSIKDNLQSLKTPAVMSFVETQVGRSELGRLSDEWWIDFFLGVTLWGIRVNTFRVI